MKKITLLFWFQKRIAIPAMAISLALSVLALGISTRACLTTIGITYLLSAPLIHYLVYEVRSPDEYYFYYNLGLSRIFLWTTTLLSAIIIALIFRFI